MSFLTVVPAFVSDAAADLARLGSTLEQANVTAAASTTGVVTAAGDEVSAAIASLFSTHGAAYQAVSGQVAAFHDEFVQLLSAGAGQYAAAEAAAADPLLAAINAPFLWAAGRPLIGDGINGATVSGIGTNGGDGGLLIGNGGTGGDSTAPSAIGGKGGTGGLLWGNGGRGGSGGPGQVVVTGGVPVSAVSAGAGGNGGQALLFGNGGGGGDGGPAVVIEDGVPHTVPLVGAAGRGGSAGLFVGAGGLPGGGFIPTGVNLNGRDGLISPVWPQ